MRIGHYEHKIWVQGGVASYIRRISLAQRAAGHQVYFFSKQPSQGCNDEEQPIVVEQDTELFLQAEKLKLDILHLHASVDIAPCLPAHLTHPAHPQTLLPSGGKFLQRWQRPCDRPYSLHGCLWGHLVDYCGSIRPQNLYSNLQRTQREMATLAKIPVVAVSHFLKQQMVNTGYAEDLIHVLHLFAPAVANDSPPPADGIPRFVFLGRIVPQKGLEWLLRSLQQVNIPVHLDIAGEGYILPDMQRLAQQLNLTETVTFHGWVNEQRVNELIRSARALIFPSIWHEPGGTVAFEAMAHSRAVIMSRVGGMPEIVLQEVNGLLVEPNSIRELVHSIERLALDWSLAKQLGEAGRRQATDRYTLHNHLESLMQIYQHIHQNRCQQSPAKSLEPARSPNQH